MATRKSKPTWYTTAMARVLEGLPCPDFSMPAPKRAHRNPNPINTDTVAALERLLAAAREGAVTGFAFAAMYGQRRYCVDAVGGASDNLTFTRGMLAALDDVLGKRLEGKQSG